MIHRMEIENFYSIRETQVIDLRIGAKVPDEEGRFAEIQDGSGVRVPKTVAFFGANASGKSTVLKALSFLRWFLVLSFQTAPEQSMPLFRFADGNAEPLKIKVEFDANEVFHDESPNGPSMESEMYSYELIVGDIGSRRLVVLSEEFRALPRRGRSRLLFKRNADGSVKTGMGFSLGKLGMIVGSKLRSNVSLTATIAQFSEESPLNVLLNWARCLMSNITITKWTIDDEAEKGITQMYAENPELIASLQKVLNMVDVGITSIKIAQTENGKDVHFGHGGLSGHIPILLESEGTKQFFYIYPDIWFVLEFGGVAIVDEMDSTMHPLLLPEILRWFHNPITNPHQAQLWFSGHSASLLEELQKEEVFFAEKDGQGRTTVFGLRDIEGVRRVDNFYQKYLGGVYGAVPRIG